MTLLAIPGLIGALIAYAALLLQVCAFAHCLLQRTEAFPAAGKWTKPGWSVVTGLAIPVTYFAGALSLFGIALLVASIVYLVDVRPAVREVSGGRGGRERGSW